MNKPRISIGYYPSEVDTWQCTQAPECAQKAIVFWHRGERKRCCGSHMGDFLALFERSRKMNNETVFFIALSKSDPVARKIVKVLSLIYNCEGEYE